MLSMLNNILVYTVMLRDREHCSGEDKPSATGKDKFQLDLIIEIDVSYPNVRIADTFVQ